MAKCSKCRKNEAEEDERFNGFCLRCAEKLVKEKAEKKAEQEQWTRIHPVYPAYWFKVGFWFAAGLFVFNLIMGIIIGIIYYKFVIPYILG